MRIAIRRIGNSKGIIIPNALLTQLGLETEAEVSIKDGALIARAPTKPVRSTWAKASKNLAVLGDDALLMPAFTNAADVELVW